MKYNLPFFALSFFIFGIALSACEENTAHPNIDKMLSNDLYKTGQHCYGNYFSINNGGFLSIENGQQHVLKDNIKLVEEKDGVLMQADYGKFAVLVSFGIKENTARVVTVSTNPDLDSPKWLDFDKTGASKASVQKGVQELAQLGPFDLCQRVTSAP